MSNGHYPPVFNRTLEKTMRWIASVGEASGARDEQHAYTTLRSVLHALRDRLTPEEAVQLGAQLPMLVRGFYFDGWHPADKPKRYRHRQDFLDQVRREDPSLADDDLEHAITSVFVVLEQEMRGGELEQVRQMLPPDVRELWPVPTM